MSIFWRLFALTLVAVLPALAIQGYSELNLRSTREAEVRESALNLAYFASGELDRIIDSGHNLLIALSKLPAVQTRDATACSDYVSSLKKEFPQYTLIGAIDREGQAFCGSAELQSQESRADRPYFKRAMETGDFTLGEYTVGRILAKPVLPLVLPFFDEKQQIAGVVYASLDLAWLAAYFEQRPVGEGTTLAISDRDGTILVRLPDNARYAGTRFADVYMGYVKADKPGTDEMFGIDGVSRILGYVPVDYASKGLYVGVGLTKETVFAYVNRATRVGFGLIAVGLTLALLAAWLGGRYFLSRPLERLSLAAQQWALGNFEARADLRHGKSEIARLGTTFDTMAAKLQEQQRENASLLSTLEQKVEERAGELRASEARIRTFFDNSSECHAVLIQMPDGRFVYEEINRALEGLYGKPRDQVVGRSTEEILGPEMALFVNQKLSECLARGQPVRYLCEQGSSIVEAVAAPVADGTSRVIASARDITESRRLEEQLRQSQKMEAVGQLTGGIAHDFNNLLHVILANLDSLHRRVTMKDGEPGAKDWIRYTDAATRGAERAAALTQQLLAFSRRQPLSPKATDINKLIVGMSELLRRALGESIAIETVTAGGLWRAFVDANQLESALLNLAVNARDAMPNGGMLTIETANSSLDEAYAETHPEVTPGQYVVISVTDNGMGMSKEIATKAFDPFFTTKDVGRGTGLGLSQVYGFVKQSGGHAKIYSEPGEGTSVKLYLPRQRGGNEAMEAPEETAPTSRGVASELVLLVEDDDQVRIATGEMLRDLGFGVIAVPDGMAAIRVLKERPDINLLFTDVGLPGGMNGRQLADAARGLRPDLPVLFTTGYARNAIVHHGRLDPGIELLTKPFTDSALASKLRQMLDKR